MTYSKKAVLFDLDGTLLDTADDLGAALNHVLNSHNLPVISEKDYRPVASDGSLGLLKLGFGDKLDNYNVNELRTTFLAYYQDNIAVHTKLYPQVSQLLKTLENNNIAWGIVTNKPEGLTQRLLPHYSEFDTCQVMIGGNSLPERKPHPLPLLHACQQLNVTPSECIYVGDAPRDIEASNSAEIISVIAKWGYIKATEDVSLWQANEVAITPLDILALI